MFLSQTNNNKGRKMRRKKFFEVMDRFMAWIVVMVSWVYTYLQMHQIVHIRYVQLFAYEKTHK